MEFMTISLIVLVVAMWALIRLSRKRKTKAPRLLLNSPLISTSVRHFKPKLETVMEEHYDMLTFVAIIDLIQAEDDEDAMLPDVHLDYILLDKTNGKPCGVVQLQQSQLHDDDMKAVLQALKQVKLPFILLDLEADLSQEQILQLIQKKLEPTIMTQETKSSDFKVYLEPNQPPSDADIRLNRD